MVFKTHEDARDEIFRTLSSGKPGKTVFKSYLKIRSNDDGIFTPKMTFLRTFEIF